MELVDQDILTDLCREVYEDAGLSKTEIAEVMDVSDVAVHYMIEAPERSMIDLRTRFLESVGGYTVRGPGFVVEGEGTLPQGEVQDRLNLEDDLMDQLVQDQVLTTNDEGEVLYASFYRYAALVDPEGNTVEVSG